MTSTPHGQFRKDIQGLRAIAVGSVLLYHAGVPGLSGGYAGVDIFFVISGFLITTHLLGQLDRNGRVSFGEFYAKRIRRILPASFVILVLSLVGAVIWYPPILMDEVRRGAIATALYIPNVLFAADGTNYLASGTPSLFQHYWSLGIEEQFYLLWPLALSVGFMLLGRNRRVLFGLVTAVVIASFVWCVYLTGVSQPDAFFLLPSRMWELGAGGLAAFILLSPRFRLPAVLSDALAWLGIAGIFTVVFFFDDGTVFPSYNAGLPVLASVAVVVGGAAPGMFGPAALLGARPMQFIGTISYSLYLVHWPVLMLAKTAAGERNPLPLYVTLGLALLRVPLAWLSYRFVEEPCRRARWQWAIKPRRVIGLAVAGSASCAMVTGAAYGASQVRPQDGGVVAETFVPRDPPSSVTAIPSNMRPGLGDALDDLAEIHTNGCTLISGQSDPADCVYGDADAPRVVLFGDSHAAQWFPAIHAWAEKAGYAVEVQAKNACSALDLTMVRTGVPFTECDEWRAAVVERIAESNPALVIMSNRERSNFIREGSVTEGWMEGTRRTLDVIDAPVLVVTDSPNLGFEPTTCLSANVRDVDACAAERSRALNAERKDLERDVVTAAGASWVDLNGFLCDEELCRPILDDVLVYRDSNHLTRTFTATMAGPMGEAIEEALAGAKGEVARG